MNSASVSLIFHHGEITLMCYFLIFFLKREETIGGRRPLVRLSNAMATKIDHFSEISRSKLLTSPNFSLDLSHDHYEVTLFLEIWLKAI